MNPSSSAGRFALTAADAHPHREARSWLFVRPTAKHGLVAWLTTVDHKRIGLLYGATALLFFLVGGVEALLIRLQLAFPNNTLLTAQRYNEMFTMHGTTMIFLAIMPLSSAFFNFVMPLQIGARDVAFPRLNGFAYWLYLSGAIIVNVGWFIQSSVPDFGWFGYAPLTSAAYSNQFAGDVSTDLWVMGLQVLGVSSVIASVNFIVTIINLRAPGMTMMRVPTFAWMTLVTAFQVILAFPAITIALVELMMDRKFGTNFFDISGGGLPILWQHLFWIFGHPEVYILILPAMGIISEILPTFARKPLFGYPVVVFSGVAIGFLAFGVWSHHMFTTGMGAVATAAFAMSTMAIAVPTGVKIFNWVGTIWGGRLVMRAPMLFALGFVWMFMIGGFSGVMHAASPADAQQHDTYFVVAHFHYVLIGGSLFALFGGILYWFPLVFGRMFSDRWGRVSFWFIMVGFNVTFFPMHFLGLAGMPRRTFTYDGNMGWNTANLISTAGAVILGIGIAIFLATVVYAVRRGPRTRHDPWDGRTVEWAFAHPPPEHNFDVLPRIRARDDFWHRKQALRTGAATEDEAAPPAGEAVHLPSQSWFPLVTALGILCGSLAFAFDATGLAIGALAVVVLGAWMWSLEGPGHQAVEVSQARS